MSELACHMTFSISILHQGIFVDIHPQVFGRIDPEHKLDSAQLMSRAKCMGFNLIRGIGMCYTLQDPDHPDQIITELQ